MPDSSTRKRLIPYFVAAGAVLVMAVVRWLLGPLLGAQLPFTTLVIAVLVVAWYGGLGPALLATGLSAFLGMFLFIPPTYSLHFIGRMEVVRVLFFTLTGAIAAMLGESRLRAQARAEASAVEAGNAADLARAEARRAEQEKARAEAAAVEAEEALKQQLTIEAALSSSEARFRAMAESSPLGIYITNPAGDCLYTNPAYQRISGLSEQQARGTGWSRAIHPDDRERVFREWYQAAERRIPFLSEHRFAHLDGKMVWTRVNASEITDQEQLVGYVGLVEDISSTPPLKRRCARVRSAIGPLSSKRQKVSGASRLEHPVPVTLPERRANRALLYPALTWRSAMTLWPKCTATARRES